MTGEGKRKIELSFAAVVLVFVAMLSVGAWQVVTVRNLAENNRALSEQGEQAHDALCVYVQDLKDRRATQKGYLVDPSQGDPIILFGLKIPRDQIEQNVANQTRVIESLDALDCY